MEFRREHLRYFVTVAEEGHMTRAAERLHIAQPTLSQAIALLEADLGFRLLARGPRGVTLTPNGNAFLIKAQIALSAWTQALTPRGVTEPAHEHTILFGFLGVPPALDSPGPLGLFSRSHPDLDLRYRELPFPSAPTVSWLAEVDVAVCHQPPADPEVWIHPLRSEPRCMLAKRTHPLAERAAVKVEDLLDQTYIGFHPSVEPSWAGFWSLDDHRGGPPRQVTPDRALNPQEVFASLAQRHAITIVPASVARLVSSTFSDLAALPIDDASPSTIALVGHEHCRTEGVAALLAFARERPRAAR